MLFRYAFHFLYASPIHTSHSPATKSLILAHCQGRDNNLSAKSTPLGRNCIKPDITLTEKSMLVFTKNQHSTSMNFMLVLCWYNLVNWPLMLVFLCWFMMFLCWFMLVKTGSDCWFMLVLMLVCAGETTIGMLFNAGIDVGLCWFMQ